VTIRTTRQFIRDARGLAAIEFAFIAPVLAIIAILMTDVGIAAVGAMNMEGAVRASVQYSMNGGADLTVAKNVGMSTWSSQPSDAAMSTSKICKCGSSVVACTSTCSNGSQPLGFFTATATGTLGGSIIHFSKTTTQTVQVN
jgi:Flp pilus assembly protein TadG